jgi:predicted nucleic acid-binding protein
MILLDTNVVSELMRPTPDAAVLAWAKLRDIEDMATTVITVAEIGAGLECLPTGARRTDLQRRWDSLLAEGFAGRIMGLDKDAATMYGELFAQRQRAGRSIGAFDLLISAIARVRDLEVATRNVRDFEDCGVKVINPWSAPARG